MLCRSKIAFLMVALAMTAFARTAAADEPAWKSLFDGKTLDGWKEFDDNGMNWEVADGLIHCKGHGGGGLESIAEYANFELKVEYKLPPGGNSGVWLRIPMDLKPHTDPSYAGMEIQVLDDNAKEYANLRPAQYCGSIYDVAPAKREFTKPAGEWNKMHIVCDNRYVKVTLNDHEIVNANLDEEKSHYDHHPGIRPDRKSGRIGLQAHTGPLDFRNIEIRVLP